jgi:hypothetical protein
MRKEDAVPVPEMLIPSSNMKEKFCAQKIVSRVVSGDL